MGRYILRRLLQSVVVLLGITFVVFAVLNLSGDPVALMLPPGATMEEMEEFRHKLGLDGPLLVQYGRFLKGALMGDFGMSFYHGIPAMDLVLERLPATLELTAAALAFTIVLGVPAGVLAAVRRNSFADMVIRILALLGQCVPVFWLGIMMIMFFSVKLHWFPTSGRGTWAQLVMPAICLGGYSTATLTRLLRSGMIEILGREYVRVAKAKGLPQGIVVMKHAFKNALSSVLTILGLQIAALLGGAVITETIFAWPGMGRLAIDSIYNRDFMVVEAVVVLMATFFVLVNLIVDILYSVIDPRIRY